MPFEDPITQAGNATWILSVRDNTGTGEFKPQLTYQILSGGLGETSIEDSETLFQKILTLIDDHPDLEIMGASRSYPTSQVITP